MCSAAERKDRLREEREPVRRERLVQRLHDDDVRAAAHDALVRVLEDLDTVAAAVLRGLAGDLGIREAMRQPVLRILGQLGGADADGHLHRAVASRVGEFRALPPQHLSDLLPEFERAVRQEHREAVAGNARGERAGARLLAEHFGDLADQLVADVHAEVVVDDMHAVDVHVEHAFRRRLSARGELRANLGLEGRAREERGQRVEVVLQRGRGLSREELDEPLRARLEIRRFLLAEHDQESDDAPGGVPHRRAEDLVGRQLDRAHLDLVDHEVAALQLRPVEQVPMDLGEDLDLRPLATRRLADGDVAFRHDQRAEQAAEVIHAGLDEHAELVALHRAVRIVRGHLEEQLEIVVARAQVARQVVDIRPRLELALQALERRLHHRLHERIGPVLAIAGQERGDGNDVAFVVTEPEDVGWRAFVVVHESIDAAGGRGRHVGERRRHERRRIRAVVALCNPERDGIRVVEADSKRAGHQHPQELSVRIEIRLRTGKVRGEVDWRGRSHGAASPKGRRPSLT